MWWARLGFNRPLKSVGRSWRLRLCKIAKRNKLMRDSQKMGSVSINFLARRSVREGGVTKGLSATSVSSTVGRRMVVEGSNSKGLVVSNDGCAD